MVFGLKPLVPQVGWHFGSLVHGLACFVDPAPCVWEPQASERFPVHQVGRKLSGRRSPEVTKGDDAARWRVV